MFTKFKKPLVYLLMTLLIMPGYLVASFFSASEALAATSGARAGVSTSSPIPGGGSNWSNPTRADSGVDTWATSTIGTNSDPTDYLKTTSYGFSVPTGMTIDGIEMSIEKHQTCTYGSCFSDVTDNIVKLLKAGTAVGTNYADTTTHWTTSDVVKTYGGPTNKWGTTWSVSDINNANFGSVFSAKRSIGGDRTVYVDQITITVYYSDKEAPTIAYHTDIIVEADSTSGAVVNYTAPQATDNVDAPAPAVCAPAPGAIFPLGTTTINCTKTDAAGNIATPKTFKVTVQDTTAPVISLLGANPMTLEAGSTYVDPGASAFDIYYGNLSSSVVVNSSLVNTSVVGSYPVTYNVTDPSHNMATEVIRTVNVVDTTAPVITSITSAPDNAGHVSLITINATDNVGITSALINIDGAGFVPLLNSAPGVYTYPIYLNAHHLDVINYTLSFSDAAGNGPTTAVRQIVPTDKDLPIISDVSNTAPTTGDPMTVTVAGTDNIAVDHAMISVDGGAWQTMDGTVSPFTLDLAVPADATSISYKVRLYDAAANYAEQSIDSIPVVDDDSPTNLIANPPAGNYSSSLTVVLSADDNLGSAGVAIYYTLDSSDPSDVTNINRHLYTTAIDISTDTTMKAVAYDDAGNQSPIFTAAYAIVPLISGETSSSISTNSVKISWTTNQISTSRVVYDTVSHPTLGSAPNYGYTFSTSENQLKVTSHSVQISDLTPGTKYYFRVISHGSPEAVGSEITFQTVASATTTPEVVTASSTTVAEVTTTPATDTSTANVQTPATTTAPTTTNADDQGKVKGDDNTATSEEDKGVNWTPWIILFILIILAGAATGGYFYWFAGEDDLEKESKPEPVTNKAAAAKPKEKAKAAPAAKPNSKKSKRW